MAEEQNRTLQDKFMLRLPDGMRERIKAAALGGGRSMNTEIVLLIDQSLSFTEALDGAPPAGDGKLSLLVRLPGDLGGRVKAAAEDNSRTVNAEIVAALEKEYPDPEFSAFEDVAEAVRRDGKPRATTLFGERAILMSLPDGSFKVSTTKMPIDEYVKNVMENGLNYVPPDSPAFKKD